MIKDGSITGYEQGVAQIQEGIDCRALWLSVIQQALIDSAQYKNENKKDLHQVIKSQWWRQIFAFAGCENELQKVSARIRANLETAPQKRIKKARCYTHATTRP